MSGMGVSYRLPPTFMYGLSDDVMNQLDWDFYSNLFG